MFQKFMRFLLIERRLATISVAAVAYFFIVLSLVPFGIRQESGERPIVFSTPIQAERVNQPPQSCTVRGSPPRIFCESPRPPSLEVASVQELLPALSEGQFVYNRLTTMWRDIPETVLLRLNLASDAAPTLPRALSGEPTLERTPVTQEMSVELRGTAGLTVEPSGAVRQRISDLTATDWQWIVTPTRSGELEVLTLTVYIHVDENGPYTLKTFEDEIQVNVTNWQWTKDTVAEINPIWAFVVGAIPVFWAAFSWIRGRKWKRSKAKWEPLSSRTRSDRGRINRRKD